LKPAGFPVPVCFSLFIVNVLFFFVIFLCSDRGLLKKLCFADCLDELKDLYQQNPKGKGRNLPVLANERTTMKSAEPTSDKEKGDQHEIFG
jgi:hypothetical protein